MAGLPMQPPGGLARQAASWTQTPCAVETVSEVLDGYANRTLGYLSQRPEPPDFGERTMWLWLTLVPTLLFMVIFYAHDIWWRRTIRSRVRRKESTQEVDAFVTTLVKKLTPSLAVESYRFKGMKKKNATVALRFENLGLTLKNGHSVLDGVTGDFAAGTMVAIMGPSGAGKTTFMNVLCGKATYGTMKGHVFVNGEERNIRDLKPVTGFVPQDDIVHERLTVREQLRFAAELRGQFGTTSSTYRDVVDDVLQVMQISHIQESIVGGVEERGISGGQRKRVNIGLELAACPVLLFLDEPTSGLDSTSSLMIIGSLQKMTQLGMTIIMVIHQPRYSLFTLFDEVLLLGKGGNTVYLGPSAGAVPYFEEVGFSRPAEDNPADWLMDVISGEVSNSQVPDFKPQFLFEKWAEKRKAEAAQAEGAQGDDTGQAGEANSSNKTRKSMARGYTVHSDKLVVAQIMETEWAKGHKNGEDDALNAAELQKVLGSCMGSYPNLELTQNLMERVSDTGLVRRDEFIDFLLGAAKLTDDTARKSKESSGILGVAGALGDTADHILAQGFATETKNDLERIVPGWFKQYRVIYHRSLVQFWRHTRRRIIDNALILVCSVILGAMHRENTAAPGNIMVCHLGLALLTTVSCLKTFADRPIFWRESASGINVFSFYTARLALDTYDVLLQTVLYIAVYYMITQPPVRFETYLVPCLMVSLATSGWGYLLSTLIPPANATTAGVVLMLVLSGVMGNPNFLKASVGEGFQEAVISISVVRWSMQMLLLGHLDEVGGLRYPPAPGQCAELNMDQRMAQAEETMKQVSATKYVEELTLAFGLGAGYESMGYWNSGLLALALQGLVLRVLGYLALRFTNRAKQV